MNFFEEIEGFLNHVGAGIGSEAHSVACRFAAFLNERANDTQEAVESTPVVEQVVQAEPAPEPTFTPDPIPETPADATPIEQIPAPETPAN